MIMLIIVSSCFLWKLIKRIFGSTDPDEEESKFKKHTIRKIRNWLSQNHKSTDYSDEFIDNTHLKFFGFSQSGEVLAVEIKKSGFIQNVNFMLILKDGSCLTIPEHTSTLAVDGNSSFSSKSLTIERISSYSKWRITYNGLSYISKPGKQADLCSLELQHVKFSFFWTAASDPLSWPNEWSPELLFHAIDNTQHPEVHLDEILISDEGFDQFGSLFGQVIIEQNESRDTFEMNLPGVRISRKLKENTKLVSECWSLAATCKDGFVVSLSATDIKDNKKIISGCLRMPNMDVHRVDYVDLDVSNLDKIESQTISFDIKTSQKIYKAVIQINPVLNRYNIDNEEYSAKLSLFTIDVNGQRGRGSIISSKFLMNEGIMTKKLFRETHIMSEPMPNYLNLKTISEAKMLTLFLDDPFAKIEQLCGGKGLSLAFLTELAMSKQESKNAFVVPQGFIITSVAFDLQLKFNSHLRNAILNIENIAYNRTKGNLDDACREAIKLFVETPIQDKITSEIKTAHFALASNCVSSLKVAVRSSAIGEDGADSSSAGQNQTFLGVQTIDQVLVSIQKCWASLFTVQSVTYRIQNIQPINTKMSVVVQSMVAPDCAGVLFTQHPVTNDPRKLLITANYGLGESVVSGGVDPDMFTVQRSYENKKLNILERKVGSKNHFIYMTNAVGVRVSEVSMKLKEKLCLSDENVLQLCEIGVYLEERYGSPRDIEWAIHKGEIYLLQSRPMTSTKSFTSWELLHEFDTAVMSEEDYFTFGNAAEVLPEVVSPLSISVMEWGKIDRSNFKSTFSQGKIAISHYRIALNMFELFFRRVSRKISLADRLIGISTFGHETLTDEALRIVQHRNGTIKTLSQLLFRFNLIKTAWSARSNAKKFGQFIEQFKKDCECEKINSENLTLKTLYENIEQKIGHRFYAIDVHEKITMICSAYQTILFLIIAEGKTEITSEYSNDITILLGSCKHAESAAIPILLEKIASTILKCGKLVVQEFCNINPGEGVKWLIENCADAYTLFESFIVCHGHRGYREYDLAAVVWGMNPKLVIEMLQKMIENWKVSDSNGKNSNNKQSNNEILAKLKTPTKTFTKFIAKFFLLQSQAFVELRERTKSYYVAYIHELRQYYCVLAERMQKQGLLPDANLIFYLTHREIGYLINNNGSSNMISKANRRRRFSPEWNKLQFDEFHWGLIKPRNVNQIAVTCDAMKVTGTPVCEGKVTGRACVVKSFGEVSKIKAGDILITHGTDIAWSPYFPSLSGVVTELGGLISHGAVVAREYGLPCIVGATNATEIFDDGDVIYMDANAGAVMKITDPNQART